MTRPTDSWTDRLSEYVDGDLDAATRAALDAHGHDLWTRVEAGIPARGSGAARPIRRRVITLSLARLAAAAGIVAAVVGGTTWAIATRRGAPAPTVVRATDSAGVGTPGEGGSLTLGAPALAVASYRDAAADLERTFDAGRATLRPETMRIIEENLRTIDHAIAQADSALRRDPGSAYLNQYLAETMQRKLKLLRRAVEITAARS
jgi:hypothetical protein